MPARRFVPVACFAVALALLAACRPPVTTQPAHPPVWRIEQGQTTVYLFGSAHALTPEALWRSPALEAALLDAETVVFEIAPGPAAEAQALALLQSLGRNPTGVTLTSQMAPEDSARLARVAARLGLSLEALETLRPWAAAQQIALAAALAQGAQPALGVETVLAANLADKKTAGLETPAQQIRLMAGLPPALQGRLLSLALQQAEENPDALMQAQAAWLEGDFETIAALARESFEAVDPSFYQALIVTRNQAFAAAAQSWLTGADEDVLLVVGAAHLGGDQGVVALLRAQGLAVSGP